MHDILKVSGLTFEMVNSLETYIMRCVALVGMIIYRLRLNVTYLSICEILSESTPSAVSAFIKVYYTRTNNYHGCSGLVYDALQNTKKTCGYLQYRFRLFYHALINYLSNILFRCDKT
jgi:hypothetical protein